MRHIFMKEQGSALIMTLVVMVVISIFIATLLTTAVAETKIATVLDKNIQAHYLGRSGVNLGIEKMRNVIIAGDPDGFLGTDPAKDDIVEFVELLNTWAVGISPVSLSATESFTLSFESVGKRQIKVKSKGMINGSVTSEDNVTVSIEMLTSLLTKGKAAQWYASANSAVMTAKIDPADGDPTYIGEGVLLEGKDNSPSKFPSNGGPSTFQASVIQALSVDGVSLVDTNNSSNITFDTEVILFVGGVIFMDDDRDMILKVSDIVAQNKVLSPTSVLYVSDPTRTDITTNGNPNGVGFEYANYYKYFAETSNLTTAGFDYTTYPFITSPYTRYGLVYFGGKVARVNNANFDITSNSVVDRIPYYDPAVYADGYFFFPSGIDLNGDVTELSKLIPLDKDDPMVALVNSRLKVTMSGKPFLWDEK